MAALDRLHDAETTQQDWQLFKSRSLHAGNPNITPEDQTAFLREALWLFSSNAEAHAHNMLQLRALRQPIVHMKAISTGPETRIREHPWKAGGMFRCGVHISISFCD